MSNSIINKVASLFVVFVPVLLAISVCFPSIDFGLPKISYGIDLVGGSRIVMQVDKKSIEHKNVITIMGIFEKNHQLDSKNSRTDSLAFLGANLLPNASEEFAEKYPTLLLSLNSKGFVVTGLDEYLNVKIGEAVVKNIETLRTRLNALGVADISIYRLGSDKIIVEIPNNDDIKRITSILSSSAEIGFYEAGDSSGVTLSYKGMDVIRAIEPFVTGASINKAISTIDQTTGFPIVSIELNRDGGNRMGEFTRNNIGKPIITTLIDSDYKINNNDKDSPVRIISERVISIASVGGEFSDSFMISGIGSHSDTDDLSLILRSGALTAPMYIISESSIDSRLGEENATQGFRALVIGLLLLFLYVIYLYQSRGFFSIITLIVNASLIIVSLSVLGASLTMTGLAGLILTMGMAVDANIIIIEREKELMEKSVTPLLDSFKSTALPILDANITTLLVAIILYNVSSVALKGFALTLALGVICTVISSYFINMYFSTSWLKEKHTAKDVEPATDELYD